MSSWNRARVKCIKQFASKNIIISNKQYADISIYFVLINRLFPCIFIARYLPVDVVFPMVDGQLGMIEIVQDKVGVYGGL